MEPIQQRPQRQTLDDQRSKYDTEGYEDDEIAERKRWRAVTIWQGQGGRQRDNAPHAAPGDDDAALDGGRHHGARGMKAVPADVPACGRVVAHHPRKADQNDREKNGGRDAEIGDLLLGLQILDDRANLETDEDKGENIEDEYGRLPNGIGWDTKARRGRCWRLTGDGDGVADDRQHPGETKAVGQQPDVEGRDELYNDVGRRVAASPQGAEDAQGQVRQDRAEDQAAYDAHGHARSGIREGESRRGGRDH